MGPVHWYNWNSFPSLCFLRYQPKSGWRCEEKNPLTYTGMTDSPAGTSVLIVRKERGLNGPKRIRNMIYYFNWDFFNNELDRRTRQNE